MGLCISCRRDKQQSLQNEKLERNIVSSVTTLAPLQIYIEECPQISSNTIVFKEPLKSECCCNKRLTASIGYDEWLVRPGHSDTLCCNCHEGSAVNVSLSPFIHEIGNSASNSRMANTISNMKMTNPIKELVSKRRKRYTQDGFNLDLTYIQDNLIAMGFPAERLEGVYRNHIDDVVKFLESKHKGHYKIYNLCSEKSYDCSKFQKRVADYPFVDHNPPKMELIQPFCADVHEWLSKDTKNVAAVHCKAGKGRTGTMLCCYMLHSRQFETADEVLDFYGQARTHDRKGVTIPSQRRYVNYYSMLVRENLIYTPVALQITGIILDPLPLLSSTQGHLHFSISESQRDKPYKCIKRYRSIGNDPKKGVGVTKGGALHINLDLCIPLSGDIKLEFFTKSKMMRREKLFHFWFNTFFVRESAVENNSDTTSTLHPHNNTNNSCEFDTANTMSLIFNKCELDDAHKDKTNKLYSADFKVTLKLQKVPSSGYLPTRNPTSRVSHQETPSESSEASSSEESNEEEEGWDSVDSPERLVGRYRLLSDPDLAQSLPEHYPETNNKTLGEMVQT